MTNAGLMSAANCRHRTNVLTVSEPLATTHLAYRRAKNEFNARPSERLTLTIITAVTERPDRRMRHL